MVTLPLHRVSGPTHSALNTQLGNGSNERTTLLAVRGRGGGGPRKRQPDLGAAQQDGVLCRHWKLQQQRAPGLEVEGGFLRGGLCGEDKGSDPQGSSPLDPPPGWGSGYFFLCFFELAFIYIKKRKQENFGTWCKIWIKNGLFGQPGPTGSGQEKSPWLGSRTVVEQV